MDIRDENLNVKNNLVMNRFELHDCSSLSSSSLSLSHLLTSKKDKDHEIYDASDNSVMHENDFEKKNHNKGNRNILLNVKEDEKKSSEPIFDSQVIFWNKGKYWC